jgi:hypothetical protein
MIGICPNKDFLVKFCEQREEEYMPEEVYKLIRDQDHDGELFDPIEDDKDLVKETDP